MSEMSDPGVRIEYGRNIRDKEDLGSENELWLMGRLKCR